MPVFKDTQHMYDVLGKLFRTLMADPEMGQKFQEANIVIKFTIHEPNGQIWLNSDRAVICGEADLKPTIEMSLSGDSCHQFWLKELTLPLALAKGKIKAKGPMPKVLKLLPMLKPAYEAYPAIARENGLPIQS
ncbi:SCP2 sterol-binding domain-containing protein [Desulfatirhabdium butyrativorans]|uniref:SCP2 sterol-binding domain-containing protein n=1 Tax=Desulfatirhabdium butyrativorans TaxID=340467 RepID=UPI00041A6B8F|nr:SCP2 sterol-binding domain-containing protein [Desulfatirhabdium butyrativorans]